MNVSNILQSAEQWINKYWPIYLNWLTEKLSGHSSFGILAFAGLAAILLFVYIWFRSRD